MEKQFIVAVDASKKGINAILSQLFEGNECVIAYASRVTTRYEKIFSTYEGEFSAFMFALKQCRVYLLNKEFVIYTANAAKTFLTTAQENNTRTEKWLFRIQE